MLVFASNTGSVSCISETLPKSQLLLIICNICIRLIVLSLLLISGLACWAMSSIVISGSLAVLPERKRGSNGDMFFVWLGLDSIISVIGSILFLLSERRDIMKGLMLELSPSIIDTRIWSWWHKGLREQAEVIEMFDLIF